jgi:hypothetical protein
MNPPFANDCSNRSFVVTVDIQRADRIHPGVRCSCVVHRRALLLAVPGELPKTVP